MADGTMNMMRIRSLLADVVFYCENGHFGLAEVTTEEILRTLREYRAGELRDLASERK